jgi:hypothetical protein
VGVACTNENTMIVNFHIHAWRTMLVR